MTSIILLVFAVILCIMAVYISYTGIKRYNNDEPKNDSFYKQFLHVPNMLKYTFIFNIICVVLVLGIFIINVI